MVTPTARTATVSPRSQRQRLTIQVCAAAITSLLVGNAFVRWRVVGGTAAPPLIDLVPGVLCVALLLFGYLALSSPALRDALRARVDAYGWWVGFTWPGALWAGALMYAAWLRIPVVPRALAYGVYVVCPVLVLTIGRRSTASVDAPRTVREPPRALRVVGAITALLVPAALRLLPRLPVPDRAGTDVIKYLGIGTAAWCFLILMPVPQVGYTPRLDRRSAGIAIAAFLAYAGLALPIGLVTRFLTWAPHIDVRHVLLLPVLLTLTTAVAEELVFRGVVQRSIEVGTAGYAWGRWAAIVAASLLFGFAHLPDPRYVALATLAGAVYGLVYQRTGLLLASVITHALVDWTWALLLKG